MLFSFNSSPHPNQPPARVFAQEVAPVRPSSYRPAGGQNEYKTNESNALLNKSNTRALDQIEQISIMKWPLSLYAKCRCATVQDCLSRLPLLLLFHQTHQWWRLLLAKRERGLEHVGG